MRCGQCGSTVDADAVEAYRASLDASERGDWRPFVAVENKSVRPERVSEVRERLMAARDALQGAIHDLDCAGVLDDDDRLRHVQLGEDIERAWTKMEEARRGVTDLCLCLITHEWSEVEDV